VIEKADVIFITVTEDAIEDMAKKLQTEEALRPHHILLHTSGVLPGSILGDPVKHNFRGAGSFHPFQVMPDLDNAKTLIPRSYFAIEGDQPAIDAGKAISDKLGARYVVIEAKNKILCHAAAVMASNYLVTLIDLAEFLLEKADIPREHGLSMLSRLSAGAVQAIAALGLPDALTGPIARGDTETLERHLVEIEKVSLEISKIYRTLGHRTIEIASRKGSIDEIHRRNLEILLS
jgi:predicted short-subunit dehydrogenase-like oxidoreductase (DUF2520 family)